MRMEIPLEILELFIEVLICGSCAVFLSQYNFSVQISTPKKRKISAEIEKRVVKFHRGGTSKHVKLLVIKGFRQY